MPMVSGKKFPYTEKGKADAKKSALRAALSSDKKNFEKDKLRKKISDSNSANMKRVDDKVNLSKKVDRMLPGSGYKSPAQKAAQKNSRIQAEGKYGQEMKQSDRRMQERKKK